MCGNTGAIEMCGTTGFLMNMCGATGIPLENVRFNWNSNENVRCQDISASGNPDKTSQEARHPKRFGQNLKRSAPFPEIRTKPHTKRPIVENQEQNLTKF